MAQKKPSKQIEVNKYHVNKDIVPESKSSVLSAMIKMGLLLMGIIGITMNVFKEDGWLASIFSKIFESSTNLLLIPVSIFCLWMIDRWITAQGRGETKKTGELPMYAMMAIGTYYLYKLITQGSL